MYSKTNMDKYEGEAHKCYYFSKIFLHFVVTETISIYNKSLCSIVVCCSRYTVMVQKLLLFGGEIDRKAWIVCIFGT